MPLKRIEILIIVVFPLITVSMTLMYKYFITPAYIYTYTFALPSFSFLVDYKGPKELVDRQDISLLFDKHKEFSTIKEEFLTAGFRGFLQSPTPVQIAMVFKTDKETPPDELVSKFFKKLDSFVEPRLLRLEVYYESQKRELLSRKLRSNTHGWSSPELLDELDDFDRNLESLKLMKENLSKTGVTRLIYSSRHKVNFLSPADLTFSAIIGLILAFLMVVVLRVRDRS